MKKYCHSCIDRSSAASVTVVKAHSFMLIARSTSFENLLKGPLAPSHGQIPIKCCSSAKIFRQFLR